MKSQWEKTDSSFALRYLNRPVAKLIQVMENQDSSSANVEQVPVENPDVQTTDVYEWGVPGVHSYYGHLCYECCCGPICTCGTTGELEVVQPPVMDSSICHHSVLSDHQLEVDGVIYRELKTLDRVVIQVHIFPDT